MRRPGMTTFLHRLSRLLARPADDRGRPAIARSIDRDNAEGHRRETNRLVMLRIGFNVALLLVLSSTESSIAHAKALQQLLVICAVVTSLIALIMRERWSSSVLNRWDEALFFVMIASGLRAFT